MRGRIPGQNSFVDGILVKLKYWVTFVRFKTLDLGIFYKLCSFISHASLDETPELDEYCTFK